MHQVDQNVVGHNKHAAFDLTHTTVKLLFYPSQIFIHPFLSCSGVQSTDKARCALVDCVKCAFVKRRMQLSVVHHTLHQPRPLLGVSCYNCWKIRDQLDPPFRGIIHDLHTGYKIVQLAKIRTRNPHVNWPKSQPVLTFRAANRVCNSGPIRLFDVVSVVMCMNRGFPSLKLSDFV